MCVSDQSLRRDDKVRRLSYYNLEIRDRYFSRLKEKVEAMHAHTGQKAVLCSHSYVSPLEGQRHLMCRMGGTVIMVSQSDAFPWRLC